MVDLVVTCPKGEWAEWLQEGDCAGEPETGEEYGFYLGYRLAPILPGDRLYIVAHGRLRGWAPVTRVQPGVIFRRGGAVACTITEPIPGFRGWRYRWWHREIEQSFMDWKTVGVT